MGFINRMFGRESRSIRPFKSGGPLPDGLAMRSASGMTINATTAENLATVSACVSAIGTALGSLPALVYRPVGGGREELTAHPVNRLVRAPWGLLTWPDWVEWCMGSVLLHGNALAKIEHDGRGEVTGLRPIPWRHVQPATLPDGRPAFNVSMPGEPQRRLFGNEVFYLRDRTDDGFVGRSRLSRAPDVLGNAIAVQDFAGHAWANQATPSGVVEVDARLTGDQYNSLHDRFKDRYAGTKKAGRTMILDNGLKWKSVSVSPEDAEVLASRKFSVEELCRLFQVPPPIVQSYEYNTFTNSAQASLWFAQFSLAPWAKKLESEFSRSVFLDDAQLEIDLSGLMRGDFQTRWAAWKIAVDTNILTVDEVREIEGWGPRGDVGVAV